MKNLHFFVPKGPPSKIRQNKRRGKMRCVLKLINHTKSFKEIGDVVQNGLEDLKTYYGKSGFINREQRAFVKLCSTATE